MRTFAFAAIVAVLALGVSDVSAGTRQVTTVQDVDDTTVDRVSAALVCESDGGLYAEVSMTAKLTDGGLAFIAEPTARRNCSCATAANVGACLLNARRDLKDANDL